MNDLLTKEDFVKVGHTGGLFGYDGSVRLILDSPLIEQLSKDVVFLYFSDNGMFVPRFIHSWDKEQSLVRFERISAREDARNLTDQEVYLRKRDLPKSKSIGGEGQTLWRMLDGYDLWDVSSKSLMGRILGVEEYPGGWMLEVQGEDREESLLIPLAEPLVDRIDEENRVLYMNLPEGIKEL